MGKTADSVLRFISSTASISLTNFFLLGAVYFNYGIELFSLVSFMFLVANFAFGLLNGTILTTLQVLTEYRTYHARVFFEHLKVFYMLMAVFFLLGLVVLYVFSADLTNSILLSFCVVLLSTRWFSRASFLIFKKDSAALVLDRNLSVATLASVFSSFVLTEKAFIYLFTLIMTAQLLFSLEVKKFRPRKFLVRKTNLFFKEFSRNGKFSLYGVICTEITTNFFMYFTAFAYGAKSFAVLSMCMMCFRPIQLVLSSVASSERPKIRSCIEKGQVKVRERYLNKVILLSLFFNVFGISIFLVLNQYYFFVKELVTMEVFYLMAILTCMYVVKGLRTFPILVLQYMQCYSYIFKITLYAALFTLFFTVASFYLFDFTYEFSALSVLFGEIIILIAVLKRPNLNG